MKKDNQRPKGPAYLVRPPKPSGKMQRAKTIAQVAAGAVAIGAAYFGVIALLMAPAFDLVPRV